MSREPGARPQQFVRIAAVGTVLMGVAVLLWVLDVIGLGAMVAAIAVVAVAELAWVSVVRHRAGRQRVQVHEPGRRSRDFDIEAMRHGPGFFPGGGGGGE